MITALELFDAGYTSLVCVVPPNATISEMSKISAADAGKAPGRRNSHGTWGGYNWLQYIPTRQDIASWLQAGANIGLSGKQCPAVDIDLTDDDAASAALEAVRRLYGPCMVRYGNRPKVLIPFRCDAPMRSFDMHYEREVPLLGTERQCIQFLAEGRQYVISGTHPRTMQPYVMEDPAGALLGGPDLLPRMDEDRVIKLFNAIAEALEPYGFRPVSDVEARVASDVADQRSLLAPNTESLVNYMAALPNTTPDREEYIQIGYAIKGASQDDPETGREIWHEWCSRWQGGVNDHDQVERDWDKMAPPYRTGYGWLLDRGKYYGVSAAGFEFGTAPARPEDLLGEDPTSAELEAAQAADAEVGSNVPYSDEDIVSRVVDAMAGLHIFVPETRHAYTWTGGHWTREKSGSLRWHVSELMRRMSSQVPFVLAGVAPTELARVRNKLGSIATVESVTKTVQNHASIQRNIEELDADPDVINTPAGPIDLRTGEWLDAQEVGKFCFKHTEVTPTHTGDCPRWRDFLVESMGGDHDMVDYLQRLAGYSLTGHVREQMFPFFIGDGGNGKSRFVEALSYPMGEYATTMPAALLQLRHSLGGTTDYHLAELEGARLVTTSETKSGSKWDEQRVKQLTGEDKIEARVPYGKPFKFAPQCTLIVVGNYAPELESVGEAISRRLQIVGWNNRPEKVDKDLGRKFRQEAAGILAWALEGAREWYRIGLAPPARVVDATTEQLEDEDEVGNWIAERLSMGNDVDAFTLDERELYADYASFITEWYRKPLPIKTFTKELRSKCRKLGIAYTRKGKDRRYVYMGVRLRVGPQPTNVTPLHGGKSAVDEHKADGVT